MVCFPHGGDVSPERHQEEHHPYHSSLICTPVMEIDMRGIPLSLLAALMASRAAALRRRRERRGFSSRGVFRISEIIPYSSSNSLTSFSITLLLEDCFYNDRIHRHCVMYCRHGFDVASSLTS
ncbi:unnamed protein product [Euphydryas editha]|uniref:Uncharacterized protein n=1 Tax=Euphydryas editha TaxID=104508 RepID=A0AAU9V8W8_EUPED|nr:unnamed protein product [Euphydryas editha]